MPIHHDNPAGRLYALLAQVRAKPGNQHVPMAWGEILRVPPDDWAELLRLYSLVAGLPAKVMSELDLIDAEFSSGPPPYPDLVARRWEAPVGSALAVDFSRSVQIQHCQGYLNEGTMTCLEVADHALHSYRRQPGLAESDLERIRGKVADLEADLAARPDVDPELRDFLEGHVREMSRALREVPIVGADGLREAYKSAAAEVYVLRPDEVKRADPKRRDLLLGVLGAAAAALNLGGGALTLEAALRTEAIANAQPAPTHGIPYRRPRALPAPRQSPAEPGTKDPATEVGDGERGAENGEGADSGSAAVAAE